MEKGNRMETKTSRNTMICILTFQVILIVLYALFVEYHPSVNAKTRPDNFNSEHDDSTYPMFQDVHVMIFLGFGFLMTFLKRYGFSAVGLTMLIAAIIVQWGILCQGFFRLEDGKILLNLTSIVNGDVIAAAILISFGALLGKVSPLQLLIMAVIETVIFAVNEYIGNEIFEAVDAGGSMYVHTFGAYFGLTVSWVIFKKVKMTKKDEDLEGSSYNSDLFAMVGTIFLWLFWPSFNGALVDGGDRQRAILNTYLSLTGSCIATFCVSALSSKGNKFDMVHVQNATLAGGVCVGTVADFMIQPYGALLVGVFAGTLSTLGYRFLQGYLYRNIGLHDTCGVNNLHGMPGVAAGLIGALAAFIAEEDTYGTSLYEIFPGRSPQNNSMAYQNLLNSNPTIHPGDGRTASSQALYQLAALALSLVMAIVGGLITGVTINRSIYAPIPVGSYCDDTHLFKMELPITVSAKEIRSECDTSIDLIALNKGNSLKENPND